MGESLTFFFNHSLTYYALIETNKPFFLDANVINPNANLTIDLSKTLYPAYGSLQLAKQLTVPIIPNNTQLQSFAITTTNGLNSLVSLTPLSFNPSSFGVSQVKEGTYYSGSVTQGSCYNIQNNPQSNNVLKIMSLKFFQFPVTAGNTYQIYYYHDNINNYNQTYYQCNGGTLNPVSIDYPTSFTYEGGYFTEPDNGLVIKAMSTGFINVSLIATGLVNQNYGFYFIKNNQIPIPQIVPLVFNKAISLLDAPNTTYSLNLNQPQLIAINYTNTININSVNFYWSQYDPVTGQYNYVMNNDLNAESGYLLNDSLGDLYSSNGGNYNWLYFPPGDYQLTVTGAESQFGKFQFTSVPVQTVTGNNVTLNVNQNSLYAVELPLNRVDFNYFNISTIAKDNITVNYEYAIIGKYSFLNTFDTFSDSHGNQTIGCKEVNGKWNYINETTPIFSYTKPTQMNIAPIVLIRPYSAVAYYNNNTLHTISNYTTTLTLSSSTGINNYPYINLVNGYDIGSGYQIAIPGTITDQASTPFNDDKIRENAQVYGFTLSTSHEQLYNVSIYLNGNYSTGLNSTFDSYHVWVHTGNFIDSTVFGDKVFYSTNKSAICSIDFLSLTSLSYLFVDINRYNFYNGTIEIVLTQIPVKALDLWNYQSNFSWNKTITNYESANTKPLWNITDYSFSGPGLDLLVPIVVITGSVIVIAAGVGGVVYYRKSKYP